MTGVKISSLPPIGTKVGIRSDVQILGLSDGITGRLDGASLAAMMWDAMYVHAQKVIVPCPYCASHNAITNPTCVRCGGSLGAK